MNKELVIKFVFKNLRAQSKGKKILCSRIFAKSLLRKNLCEKSLYSQKIECKKSCVRKKLS
jgi:hypothetical protein